MYDALVVLGAGFRADGEVSPALVRRARHAARLYRAGRAPAVVVTGGTLRSTDPMAEATAMAGILRDSGVPDAAVVVEPHARNTAENARFAAAILSARAWAHVGLVTDPAHMPRAAMAFRREGIRVAPERVPDAPTSTPRALRETLAYAVYGVRYIVRDALRPWWARRRAGGASAK
jgi:uncharacterized SAM-binding protein YcdF (DUF218 family)